MGELPAGDLLIPTVVFNDYIPSVLGDRFKNLEPYIIVSQYNRTSINAVLGEKVIDYAILDKLADNFKSVEFTRDQLEYMSVRLASNHRIRWY